MTNIPYGFVQKPNVICVEPQQAHIVQQIYQRYLTGDSLGGIAAFLFESGISSPQGKERWTRPVIMNVLSNQKYIGYIIHFETFFLVQGEKGKHSNIDEDTGKRKAARYSSQNILSGLLICAECGANYRRITRPSGEVVWRCANKVEHGKKICKHAPSIPEVQLKQSVCEMLGMDELNPQEIKDRLEFIQVKADRTLEPEMVQSEFQAFYSNHV